VESEAREKQTLLGFSNLPSLKWSNDIVQALYLDHAAQVPRTMANIAEAMTNTMRLNSGQQAMGTAMVLESYVHVPWLWLVLPLIMVILAIVFLVLTR
jgi:hypothetical protein